MTMDTPMPVRVRFEVRLRPLQVVDRLLLTPHMLRIVLRGDLEGFQSLGFDDHVKLFLPDPQTGEIVLPDPNRANGPKPLMRDYTPRAYDVTKGLLTLDFALHQPAGPATQWALHSRVGDALHIGGPRGSTVWPETSAQFVMIGDETALPAIGRRLEKAEANAKITALAVVESAAERQNWATQGEADIRWHYRAAGDYGLEAIEKLSLTEDAFIWVAGESSWVRSIRTLLTQKGINPRRIKASGYWRKGETGQHENID